MLLMTHCRPVLSLHVYIDGHQPCILEARLQELVSVAGTVSVDLQSVSFSWSKNPSDIAALKARQHPCLSLLAAKSLQDWNL